MRCTMPMHAPMSPSDGLLCQFPSASITIGVADSGHVELPQQRLRLRVGLQVVPAEGDSVPVGEVPKPVRLGGEARADDADALEAVLEQQLPSHEEGLQKRRADIGELVHHLPQLLCVELDDPTVAGRPRLHQHGSAGKRVRRRGEPAGPVPHHGLTGASGMLDDLDLTLEHDEEVDVPGAFGEEDLAVVNGTHAAAALQGGDVLGSERRERDVSVGSHMRNLDPPDQSAIVSASSSSTSASVRPERLSTPKL